MKDMNFSNRVLLGTLSVVAVLAAPPGRAQTNTAQTENKTAASPEAEAQRNNTQTYIDLLRSDVRQRKAEIMGAVMLLSAQDAAKFWPIYSDYDAQLTKLNAQRVKNIKEYARTYDQMTGLSKFWVQ
jgi:hypothetical protein